MENNLRNASNNCLLQDLYNRLNNALSEVEKIIKKMTDPTKTRYGFFPIKFNKEGKKEKNKTIFLCISIPEFSVR